MIIRVHDPDDPRVAVFFHLTDAFLRQKQHPEKALFIAEGPKVVRTALECGLRPVSVLIRERHIDRAGELLSLCGDVPVYTGDDDTLAALTGFRLERSWILCAMERPQTRTMEEVCREAHRVAVLEDGLHFTPISISPNEAQFLETRKFQINEIARIFRVPPHMVGDLDKSSFSNIEQQSLEFVKYTLDPWVVRWEQSLFRSLFSADEKKLYFFKFNVEGLLRGDYQSRMNGYATARQNGWMSTNDIRELENMDKIPAEQGGDLYLINGNMMPISMAGCQYTNQSTETEDSDNGNEEVLELDKPSPERKRIGR